MLRKASATPRAVRIAAATPRRAQACAPSLAPLASTRRRSAFPRTRLVAARRRTSSFEVGRIMKLSSLVLAFALASGSATLEVKSKVRGMLQRANHFTARVDSTPSRRACRWRGGTGPAPLARRLHPPMGGCARVRRTTASSPISSACV